jgi:hypothetical protein
VSLCLQSSESIALAQDMPVISVKGSNNFVYKLTVLDSIYGSELDKQIPQLHNQGFSYLQQSSRLIVSHRLSLLISEDDLGQLRKHGTFFEKRTAGDLNFRTSPLNL